MIVLSCERRAALPVGKVVAVGRNFVDHAKEMGHAARDAEPLLFLKPASALRPDGGAIVLPRHSKKVHHEVELVVRIGRELRAGDEAEAAAAIDAIAVGLDLTARDLQEAAKQRGDPWAVAKGFDDSAPLSRLVPLDDPLQLRALELSLTVNGELRQRGTTRDLVTPVVPLVAFVSHRFRLEAGDLLFCGTPAGVGPLVVGDRARAELRAEGGGAPLATLAISCC